LPLLELICLFNLQSGVDNTTKYQRPGRPKGSYDKGPRKERQVVDTRGDDQDQTTDHQQLSSGTIPILPEIRFDGPASGPTFIITDHFVIGAEISIPQQLTAVGNTQSISCMSDYLLQFGVTFVADSDPFHGDWPFW
jgi:hypothetical protein